MKLASVVGATAIVIGLTTWLFWPRTNNDNLCPPWHWMNEKELKPYILANLKSNKSCNFDFNYDADSKEKCASLSVHKGPDTVQWAGNDFDLSYGVKISSDKRTTYYGTSNTCGRISIIGHETEEISQF
ncbi:hypothetical protein [Asticcacaulis sp.]|uniref:hypothetical protein n=1 Tax=Asticcacaulis sp. TaxID=1872648 RepID=UPI002BE5170C|nr:hypothetical protein [Asticcacaulis sp.]HTM81117.1 hypothetical protein [Asticcacaulis sp.]